MMRVRSGIVLRVGTFTDGVAELTVMVDGEQAPAIHYETLLGPVQPGDEVLLNTTAVHLGLGTGGVHFVMGVSGRRHDFDGPGHIMKCRYTPSQVAVLAVEEPESPYHEVMVDGDLDGTPVIAAGLHSMMAAAAVAARLAAPKARIVYVMTDGAALPARFSRLVGHLRAEGFLDAVITCGNAFGGDFEAVTLHSGLLAARRVCHADIILAAMGPGVVGTGTRWGTTAIEQGLIVDAAHVLAGRPVAAPRLSFADARERHRGISHHTLTALGRVAAHRCTVALPSLSGDQHRLVMQQLNESGISTRHRIEWHDTWSIISELERLPFRLTTMGRTPSQDPAPFASAAAAAAAALSA